MKIEYRIWITEIGNEQAHVSYIKAQSDAGARRSLARALRPYGGDGYGWIDWRNEGDGKDMWRTL